VLLILGTNEQPSEPQHTHTHSRNLHDLLLVLHQSDRWPAPVRPVDRVGQAGGYSSHTTNVLESLSDFSRPWNKNTPKTQPARKKNPTQSQPKHHQNYQELTSNHTTQKNGFSNSPKENHTKGSHRSDRSRAPVTPGQPGQLGMNRTRESTPPNPTPDLPIRSTESSKTLGIVGTPHGHSIAKLWSTKTR
jgi:hypothetical protein